MFREYPYLNLQDLNLDYILRKIREMQKELNNFVVTNAIKYADPIDWNITTQYEKNTVVIDANSGIAYLSVQPVPSGVAITNTDYWTVIFDLSMFIDKAAKNLTNHVESDETSTATFTSAVGDWLIWYDELYVVESNINIGDSYVIGGNIRHFTIEDFMGHLDNLTTTDKTNIVSAINELVTNVTNIEATLDTIVSNINVLTYGADPTGVNDSLSAFLQALTDAETNGLKIYIPSGTYLLSKPILTTADLVESDNGAYSSNKLVLSTNNIEPFRHTEFIRKLNFIPSGYSLQSVEYIASDNYYVVGYTSGDEGRLIVYDRDFNIIRDSGDLLIGHVNDLAYNPSARTLTTVAGTYGVNANKIIVISYDSLTITNTIDIDMPAWQVSYDKDNKFYALFVTDGVDYLIRFYDENYLLFDTVHYEVPLSITGNIITQSTFIYKGQLYFIYNVEETINSYSNLTAFGILKYNYSNGNIISYEQYNTTTMRDEMECACIINDIIYIFGGQFFFIGKQIIPDNVASSGTIDNGSYISMIESGTDLNDILSPGRYTSGWSAITSTILNKPNNVSSGFNLDVTLQGVDHVVQKLYENSLQIEFIREYSAPDNTWSSWHTPVCNFGSAGIPKIESFTWWEDSALTPSTPYFEKTLPLNNVYASTPVVVASILSNNNDSKYDDCTVRIMNVTTTDVKFRIYYHGADNNGTSPAVYLMVYGS